MVGLKRSLTFICFLFLNLVVTSALASSKNYDPYEFERDYPEASKIIKESGCTYCKYLKQNDETKPVSKDVTILKMRVKPGVIKDQEAQDIFGHYGFDPSSEGFDVLIGIINDHNIFALGLIKERGDDFGYTHGAILEVGKSINRNYRLEFKYTSDLYSKQMSGRIFQDDENYKVEQFIANENLYRIILNSYQLGDLFYYRVETGWHQIDHAPNDKNFLLASSQQLRFHKLLNSIKPGMNMIPKNLDDDVSKQSGMIAGLFFGSEQIFGFKENSIRFKINEEIGSTYSNATDFNYLEAEVKGTLTYQRSPKKLVYEFGLGSKAKTHPDGTSVTHFIDFGIGRTKKWKVGIRVNYYNGDLENTSGYNLENDELGIIDPTARIYYKYYFD